MPARCVLSLCTLCLSYCRVPNVFWHLAWQSGLFPHLTPTPCHRICLTGSFAKEKIGHVFNFSGGAWKTSDRVLNLVMSLRNTVRPQGGQEGRYLSLGRVMKFGWNWKCCSPRRRFLPVCRAESPICLSKANLLRSVRTSMRAELGDQICCLWLLHFHCASATSYGLGYFHWALQKTPLERRCSKEQVTG